MRRVVLLALCAVACGCGDVGEQLLSKDAVNTAAVQRVERKLDSLRAEIRIARPLASKSWSGCVFIVTDRDTILLDSLRVVKR